MYMPKKPISSDFISVPGEGQISLNFNNKVNFKGLCKSVCVKDKKHIEHDFFS